MSQPKSITIVGGGLAGLTLGIGLRLEGVPVVIWEAGHYPRHRVCGEFISGKGQDVLRRLGLLDLPRMLGGRPASLAAFFTTKSRLSTWPLPTPAVCVSRFVLDEWLARKFCALGGELRTGTRWREEAAAQEGLVRSTGRRVESGEGGRRWYGLKVHARNVSLTADLEMHLGSDAYTGLCRIAEDRVNVCGFFRARANGRSFAQSWKERLAGEVESPLHARLSGAEWLPETFCSVAGISLFGPASESECSIGDAFTMTPPVTGNGMSMAFESADLAVIPLSEYAKGNLPWAEVLSRVREQCELAFSTRLRWAKMLELLLFQRWISPIAVPMAGRSGWMGRLLFERTR